MQKAIEDLVSEHKEKFEKQLDRFSQAISQKVKSMGIDDIVEPKVAEGLIDIPDDISKLTDEDVGRRHFAAIQWHCYLSVCCSRASVRKTAAAEARDGAYAEAILIADGKSAEDRKAWAERDPVYRAWNAIYMEENGIHKILEANAAAWERRKEAYSREITLRQGTREYSRGA